MVPLREVEVNNGVREKYSNATSLNFALLVFICINANRSALCVSYPCSYNLSMGAVALTTDPLYMIFISLYFGAHFGLCEQTTLCRQT